MQKRQLCHRLDLELPRAIHHLETLISSLRSGTICVEQNGEAVTLTPEQQVTFEIEARSGRNKEAILIELSWRKPVEREEKPPFRISSAKPKA